MAKKIKVAVTHENPQILPVDAGRTWKIVCSCGFETSVWENIEGAGSEMDDHWRQVKSGSGRTA